MIRTFVTLAALIFTALLHGHEYTPSQAPTTAPQPASSAVIADVLTGPLARTGDPATATPDATPDDDAYLDGDGCMRWHSTPEDAPVCDQYQVDLTVPADPIAACLVADGWSGSNSDGRAVIYAPWRWIERETVRCGERQV